jgi:hypothetical protein
MTLLRHQPSIPLLTQDTLTAVAYEELGLIGCADHSTSRTMTFSKSRPRNSENLKPHRYWTVVLCCFGERQADGPE